MVSIKEPPAPGRTVLSLTVGGLERHCLVHVPPGYDGNWPVPVVLAFHGTGATGLWTLEETGWADKADREGFLAAFPDGLPPDPSRPARFLANPPFWDAGRGGQVTRPSVDDLAFVSALLDTLRSRFAVDARRVYVTGFSNGASFAFR